MSQSFRRVALRSIVLLAAVILAVAHLSFDAAARQRGGGPSGGRNRGRAPYVTRNRPPNPPPAPVPDGLRVEVGWIAREPRLPPPSTLDAPLQEGWPRDGSAVHWVAHVLNRGTAPIADVAYEWRIDGERALAGVTALAPGDNEILLPWNWTFKRHEIAFRIVPPAAAGDNTPDDNQVTVSSDALALVIYTQQGLYDWTLAERRPGFERLFQGEITRWNALLARAVYESAPKGVLDRIRLDDVIVLPEGQRLRNQDFMVSDLVWFFPSTNIDNRFLSTTMDVARLGDQTIVLHELLHERGLTDFYDYDVIHEHAPDGGKINITENGKPVVGTFLMPPLASGSIGVVVFRARIDGLMGAQYVASATLEEHSVHGLNLLAGRRTPWWSDRWGNVIGLGNVQNPGSYVLLMPDVTELHLVDQDGSAIAGATVDIYGDKDERAYDDTYADRPDASIVADGRGVAMVPREILLGTIPRTALPKSRVFIIGIRTARARGFAFVPAYDLNLSYFRGNRDRGALKVVVKMHSWAY